MNKKTSICNVTGAPTLWIRREGSLRVFCIQAIRRILLEEQTIQAEIKN